MNGYSRVGGRYTTFTSRCMSPVCWGCPGAFSKIRILNEVLFCLQYSLAYGIKEFKTSPQMMVMSFRPVLAVINGEHMLVHVLECSIELPGAKKLELEPFKELQALSAWNPGIVLKS